MQMVSVPAVRFF